MFEDSPLKSNRSVPSSCVIPVLAYRDVRLAVEWLERVFGFKERLRIAEHRSQMTFRDSAVIVGEYIQKDSPPDFPPSKLASQYHSIIVRVPDVNSHYEHSKNCRAEILQTPIDHIYGEREYIVRDIGGHRWVFIETINDVDPAEWGGELKDSMSK